MFCASRLMPARKVYKKSAKTKNSRASRFVPASTAEKMFFRASCLRLRFKRKRCELKFARFASRACVYRLQEKQGKKKFALRASPQGIERIVCHAERFRPVQM